MNDINPKTMHQWLNKPNNITPMFSNYWINSNKSMKLTAIFPSLVHTYSTLERDDLTRFIHYCLFIHSDHTTDSAPMICQIRNPATYGELQVQYTYMHTYNRADMTVFPHLLYLPLIFL